VKRSAVVETLDELKAEGSIKGRSSKGIIIFLGWRYQ